MSEYLEHKKLLKVQKESQSIGEFLDWLIDEKGYCLADHNEYGRLFPARASTESLLAEYFEIDRKKLEEEKREMLKKIREAATRTTS